MKTLTHERLVEVLNYNPRTGIFTWRTPRPKIRVGDVAGSPDGRGYLRIKIDGRLYASHRLAWLYVHGEWPHQHIDHINRVRNDNRIANLRDVDHSTNLRNQNTYANNTSGRVGIDQRRGKWRARIGANGKLIELGMFETLEEAIAARKNAEFRFGFLSEKAA